ncbi:glycosyltransferase family 34 protein [Trematosphaeria pertusa]|uniref:Glycosyltransferase family 34 protein n=1 Tax=Trematosphaeria pertusa TaxID=390896 RepID=A0A6A6J284_9PLEO|nr:glycosyltransferase family 34 protein [Trematosphaeria pertusa]KAF2256829.1 glycosyltransferase family 34 protein [Trematosphaeria pertusa]
MPPRKTSRPPPYAARNQSSLPIPPALKNLLRRDKVRLLALGILGFLTILWLLGRIGGRGGRSTPAIAKVAIGTGPPVVIVTVLDPKANPAWIEKIKKNREDYAKRHGYLTFFPNNTQYPLRNSPPSWSKVPAIRHAMTLHPGSTFFWYLDSTALIMNPSINLQTQLLNAARLEKLMIINEPVVPPDSVIKTFGNLKGNRIDFVVTQDKEGLTPTSFIIRNGEWAKYFLDAWFDPIYRSYNFQKAETHALEHIVQWHGTILAKLALVPQNMLNSYASGPANPKHGKYKEGDLVANFPGCDKDKRDCADEQQPFFDILDGKNKGQD